MSVVFLFSGIAGTAAGGFLADFGQRIAGNGGILLGTVIGAALSIPAALFPLMPGVSTFAIMLTLLLTAGAITSIASTAAIAVLVPNELRGITVSIFSSTALLMSFGVAPSLVSLGAQAMGLGAQVGAPLAVVGGATSVAGLVAFVTAFRVARAQGKAGAG